MKVFRAFLAAAILIAGIALLFWGDIASAVIRAGFKNQIDLIESTRADLAHSGQDRNATSEAYAACYENLVAYNSAVSAGEFQANDPFSGRSVEAALEQLGIPNGLIGTVSIPSMGCELPLYFAATDEHLSEGAAVIAGTSLPLGGPSTNCVIAAHRSYGAYFKNIDQVQAGDTLEIQTPWGYLEYAAVGAKIISPNDLESVSIFPGEDMVTLISCHPYGTSDLRYVVYFHRVSEDGTQPGASQENFPNKSDASGSLGVERMSKVAGATLIFAFVLATLGRKLFRKRGKHSREHG